MQTSILQDNSFNIKTFIDLLQAPSLNVEKCINELQKFIPFLFQNKYSEKDYTQRDNENIFFALSAIFNTKDMVLKRLTIFTILNLLPVDTSFMMTQSIRKVLASSFDPSRPSTIRLVSFLVSAETLLKSDKTALNDFIPDFKQALNSDDKYYIKMSCSTLLSLYYNGLKQVKTSSELKMLQSNFKLFIPELTKISTKSDSNCFIALSLLYSLSSSEPTELAQLLGKISNSSQICYNVMSSIIYTLFKLSSSTFPTNQKKSKTKIPPHVDKAIKILYDRLSRDSKQQLDSIRTILSCPELKEEYPDVFKKCFNTLFILLTNPGLAAIPFGALRTIVKYADFYSEEFSEYSDAINIYIGKQTGRSSIALGIEALIQILPNSLEKCNKALNDLKTIGPDKYSIKDLNLTMEMQIRIIKACSKAILRQPIKLEPLLAFIWSNFRPMDGNELHLTIVETFIDVSLISKDSSKIVCNYLMEYLEDCAYVDVSNRILAFMGLEGPKLDNKTDIIASICNRLLLDPADIRGAAIDALYGFTQCSDKNLSNSVKEIIENYIDDNDDEVRNRALLYSVLIQDSKSFETEFDGFDQYLMQIPSSQLSTQFSSQFSSQMPSQFSSQMSSQFSEKAQNIQSSQNMNLNQNRNININNNINQKGIRKGYENLPEGHGNCLFESREVELTNEEIISSYVVRTFQDCIAFVFKITNNLEYQITNINLRFGDELTEEEEELDNNIIIQYIPCDKIDINSTGYVYAIYPRSSSKDLPLYSFDDDHSPTLFFTADDTEESYQLGEPISLNMFSYTLGYDENEIKEFHWKENWDQCPALISQTKGQMDCRKFDEALERIKNITGLDLIKSKKDVLENSKIKGGEIMNCKLAGKALGQSLVMADLNLLYVAVLSKDGKSKKKATGFTITIKAQEKIYAQKILESIFPK